MELKPQANHSLQRAFPKMSKHFEVGYYYAYDWHPLLGEILWRLFNALFTPLVAIKALIWRTPLRVLFHPQIPWTKTVLVLGCAYFIFDFNFQTKWGSNDTDEMGWAKQVADHYSPLGVEDLKERETLEFIKDYAPVAISDMKKYNVPASIKMAQALIESRYGTSRLAVNNNNYFGIKCFSKICKKGHCSNHNDDHHKDFFVKFKTPADGWSHHSKMLASGRYKPLLKYENDYKKWAVGLKNLGYATDKTYDKKLIAVIEKYQLYKLDKM